MQEFLNMGGYGRYVWSAYGLWLAVLAWNVWSAVRLERAARVRARRRALIGTVEEGDNGSR
jgi:heme exporter protein CcmD